MADLRYPVGEFAPPSTFTAADRAAAIRTLAELPARLRLACAGLGDAQLDTPYRPDGWTVRQVVHHTADSHTHAYIRLKFALTEDNPTIKPYAEAVWAELTDARSAPVAWSLDLLDALHARLVTVLRGLDAPAFARTLFHPERGAMTLDAYLALYEWHSRHHTAHITALRAREGW
ncbi:MAG: YfiT family bacillithiol transferase [Vicinamibacterales bacterium]